MLYCYDKKIIDDLLDGYQKSSGVSMTRIPSPTVPTSPPRLYADLLAEVERRRRAADDLIVRRMLAVRSTD